MTAAATDVGIEDVLVYANAVAALNCRALGARGGIPTVDEVERLLATAAAVVTLVFPPPIR